MHPSYIPPIFFEGGYAFGGLVSSRDTQVRRGLEVQLVLGRWHSLLLLGRRRALGYYGQKNVPFDEWTSGP